MDLHFLNGDSLLAKFPLKGEIRSMREAIIDGPLLPDTGQEFEQARARFHAGYDPRGEAFYQEKVAPEWKALAQTPASRVLFWFDADAFCQLNQVFLLAWLAQNPQAQAGKAFFYIRPQAEEFTAMQGGDFAACLNDAMPISPELIAQAEKVWQALARQDFEALEYQIQKLPGNHFALRRALRWYADHYRPDPATGRPRLISELKKWLVPGMEPMRKEDAFRLFRNRYKLAGLGDVQFYRLWAEASGNGQGPARPSTFAA